HAVLPVVPGLPWLIPLNVLPILLLSHTTDIASTFVTKFYLSSLQMNNHSYRLNFNSSKAYAMGGKYVQFLSEAFFEVTRFYLFRSHHPATTCRNTEIREEKRH